MYTASLSKSETYITRFLPVNQQYCIKEIKDTINGSGNKIISYLYNKIKLECLYVILK